MPIVGIEAYQEKQFIILWCPGGDNRPYSSLKTMARDNKERIHYIRKASNMVEPSDDEEKDLFNLANRVPFDDRVNHQAEMSDLNITLIQNYLKEVKSSLYEKSKPRDYVEVCRDMNIISNLPEYVKPKNVGLMFFGMDPDKFFPYTQIDVVQFPEGLGGNNIIENTFKGLIHQQLRDALRFVKNTIITEKVVKHPDRAEADRFFNYPYAAIEEALSNAVYHRAYDVRELIEVRIERDRIEIVSFPGPDRSVTPQEGLKNYRVSNRRYRNRRIGDFLKELHLTEGRNTGFKKILNALEANGSPKPEFETDADHSYFISRLFVHEGFLKEENEKERVLTPSMKEVSNFNQKNERSLSKVLSVVLSKKDYSKVEKLIAYIEKNGAITRKEAKNICNKSSATVRRYLKKIVDSGYVEMQGSTNNVIYRVCNKTKK
ncbi:MAG: AAA family ATPase [Clostridiales bacterium]|nr:AAA family ATPase [Clostridiales bacterium]